MCSRTREVGKVPTTQASEHLIVDLQDPQKKPGMVAHTWNSSTEEWKPVDP